MSWRIRFFAALEPGTLGVPRPRCRAYPRDTVVTVANGRSSALDVAMQPVVSRLDAVVVQSTRDSTSGITFDRRAIEQSGRRDLGELFCKVCRAL
jgi:hypothetical protein